ncbi:hypothetical protein HN832_03490 [archaeon]|jgi:hypothetical protein|nr:hypothetical protein [archaeon]MBT4373540.1 hypothetical protein [archaeon]MBT4531988.1 hypothetical protein [archaeon]MBT7001655.1 hypothetical protein [archaeon]MBT7282453.1 hypothetical protein [archaeon]
MIKEKEGWQSKVKFYNNYVIKKLKSPREIEEGIKQYLKKKNKSHELKELVKKTIKLTNTSLKIIKKTKAPKDYFGNPEFIGPREIKQDRAILMSDALENLISKNKISEAQKLIDQYIKLILNLWQYKIHELNYKFYSNYGVINNQVILLDFLEITEDKKEVIDYIKNKKWDSKKDLKKRIPPKLIEYYIKKMNENINLKNLEKFWK